MAFPAAEHHIAAGPETAHWGVFSADLPPRLTVASGDIVTISTLSGGPADMPPAPFAVPDALNAIHDRLPRPAAGHICTGPIAVSGAKPGDVLQIDILSIEPASDWGYGFFRPLSGALPFDFDAPKRVHYAIDRAARTARLPWGQILPLAPFFGVMATAPPRGWGAISTLPPRPNGGNLDNKELVAGTTLFLPVFVEEALFSVGDGHGAQGDGEVCVTAIETALQGRFRLTLRRDMALQGPFAETPTHLMTMAFDPLLDNCVPIALRLMLDQIVARSKLTREEAYILCSLAADVRVTQVVNGSKGVHVMLARDRIPA
jgi:acetamidase/formamidase